MKQFLVQYRTHPERANENQALIAAVFAELRETPIAGMDYQAMRLDDDTFVHVVTIAPGVADDAITKLAAFQAFQRDLRARCVEPPVRRAATVVGSHAGRK
jgi:hypothetical protein